MCRNLKEQLLVDLGFEIPWRTPAFFSSVKGDISDHEAKKEAKKEKADVTAFGCARPAPPHCIILVVLVVVVVVVVQQ